MQGYCSRCKEFRNASKKMDIWRLPPILAIHLKRFQYTQYSRRKLRNLVHFPVNGLDLSPYVVKDEASTGSAAGGNGGRKETDDRTHPNTPYHSAETATAEAAAAASAAAAAAVADGYGSSAGEQVPDALSAPEVASSSLTGAAGAGAGGDDGAGSRGRVDGGGRAEDRRNWSSSDNGGGDDPGIGGSLRGGGSDVVEQKPDSVG
ncbi:unnamed protein product [Sphacelaria rigidula]